MHLEIERKFLVRSEAWRGRTIARRPFRDGLVSQGANGKVRVRVEGQRAWLTVKGARSGISRPEFEYEIPLSDAEELLAGVCTGRVIEKVRHVVPDSGATWEVDVFAGPLSGLVWAEIELEREDQAFALPDWIGREVTGDPRFRQANLLLLCEGQRGAAELAGLLLEASGGFAETLDAPRATAAGRPYGP